MRRALSALALIAALAGGSASAHHSYASYDTTRTIDIEGIVEQFQWAAPHSLVKIKADDARVYTGEWGAPNSLQRSGIGPETLKPGDRLVVAGNPHRNIDENGVLNLRSVRRPADGWTWRAR